jgi:NAD(P)-dependent dehydrogenase (short-subunit alcohol dehydrogenase family)
MPAINKLDGRSFGMSYHRFSLEGKIALVTGARRGIGKAIALGLAEAGADVAVCDMVIEGGELREVAKKIRSLGRRSLSVKCDVTKKSQIGKMVERVERRLGPIDILVNNAGIESRYNMLETTEDEWHKVLNADLTSCYLCSQAVGKGMVQRRRGSIINIASGAGIRGFAGRNTYNVAKAGVIMLTKILARDWGKYNVRVNAIAPTIVKTDMTKHIDEKAAAAEAARIPLGRLAEVNDLVGPAIFLASDAAGYIAGDTIMVDGGQLA